MPEPRSIQKKPAASETAVTGTAADSIASGSKPPSPAAQDDPARPRELGGPAGPEPTRYGDWEHKGRCIDF